MIKCWVRVEGDTELREGTCEMGKRWGKMINVTLTYSRSNSV